MMTTLLPQVIDIAKASGQLIADIYQQGQFEQMIKQDDTPSPVLI